jgi:hypothetical protein
MSTNRPIASANNVSAPAANTAATVTATGQDNQYIIFQVIMWSYNGAPTGGNISAVTTGGATILDWDITTSGPGFVPIPEKGLQSPSPGEAVTITLTAGGATVSGKLNAYWIYGT